MIRSLQPLHRTWERFILRWALRDLHPSHWVIPHIVRRLGDHERAPSPMDPADSIVVGACVIASLALLALVVLVPAAR